jgi:hypothetical protein
MKNGEEQALSGKKNGPGAAAECLLSRAHRAVDSFILGG